MKVMQIIRRIRFAEWGGTENVVWNSSRELLANGIDTEILATNALGGEAFEQREGLTIRRFDCFYPYFPLSAGRRRMLDKKGGNPVCFGMADYLRRQRFDLIHTHNAGRLAELAAGAARRRGVPLVVSLHGGCFDIPEQEKAEMLRPLRHTFSYGGAIERLLRLRCDYLAQAAGVICVGANEEAELRRRYPDKLIRFLPNGVDVDKFARPAAFDWHRELKLEDGVRILLNVSRIDYQKNQKLLVRLLAELKARGDRVHLLLIGPVTAEWYGRELLALAESLQVREQLTLVPGLPPDDERLAAAYQQAEVFLLPSLHEPFGIVVLEAWSAGVPVLAARVGGLRYLVEEGKTGLQFDPEALPSLLAAYDALPPLRMQLGRNARAEVAARYGWPVIGRQLAEFYREVIAYYNHRDLRNGKSSE